MARFDLVVESSRSACANPSRRSTRLACELLGVDPSECVFLDDLGINLKPARAMGMTTIKVGDPDVALTEFGDLLGLELAPQSSVSTLRRRRALTTMLPTGSVRNTVSRPLFDTAPLGSHQERSVDVAVPNPVRSVTEAPRASTNGPNV